MQRCVRSLETQSGRPDRGGGAGDRSGAPAPSRPGRLAGRPADAPAPSPRRAVYRRPARPGRAERPPPGTGPPAAPLREELRPPDSQRVSAHVHHQLQGRVPVLGGLAPRAALIVHGVSAPSQPHARPERVLRAQAGRSLAEEHRPGRRAATQRFRERVLRLCSRSWESALGEAAQDLEKGERLFKFDAVRLLGFFKVVYHN